jgi:hypothetical protein
VQRVVEAAIRRPVKQLELGGDVVHIKYERLRNEILYADHRTAREQSAT